MQNLLRKVMAQKRGVLTKMMIRNNKPQDRTSKTKGISYLLYFLQHAKTAYFPILSENCFLFGETMIWDNGGYEA